MPMTHLRTDDSPAMSITSDAISSTDERRITVRQRMPSSLKNKLRVIIFLTVLVLLVIVITLGN